MLSATFLLLVGPASAWTHTGYVWLPEEIPRAWYMDDGIEDSFPEEDQLPSIQAGWDAWEVPAAGCAGLENVYSGVLVHEVPANDGLTVFYWDDPGDTVESGVLAVTVNPTATDQNVEVNGLTYKHFLDTDIIFNNDVDWTTREEVVAGNCAGETDVEGVAAHEIGHSWGLNHTCEQGEPCGESLLLDATMYWSVSACNIGQDDINEDDIAGISAIYGPYGTFTATGNRYGGTPLEVCFEATSEDTIESVLWTFGDGESSTVNPVCHTYTTSGQFTVRVEMDVSSPSCGDQVVNYTSTELGYIVACEPPKPEEGADGFFQIEHATGLSYQTINYVDTSVYGCTDTVQWEVYRGTGADAITPANLVDFNGDGTGDSVGAWAPILTFPEEGSFVVLMNVGGPGGVDAGMLVVEARDVSSGGCAAVPFGMAGAGAVAAGLLATLRRRRV